MKKILFTLCISLCTFSLFAQVQDVKFAYFADTHISVGSEKILELEKCIEDVNSLPYLQFAIFAGDITEFGSDKEIKLAKSIIDKLNIPYYIVAGNHDAKWSESGCNTFAKVFGYENFEFDAGGIKFIGSNSGPNMRMAPALLPHESLVWLDSIAKVTKREQPVIFINHYPQDTSMLNYFQVINTLKRTNIQLIMGGHWHSNVKMDYMGVPGMLGRSPSAKKDAGIGYNIISISNGIISAQERIANVETRPAWYSVKMSSEPRFSTTETTKDNPYGLPSDFPWLTFEINNEYPEIQSIWRNQDESDIGGGATLSGKYVVYANTQGVIKALDSKNGKILWSFKTEGKIFSTPAIEKKRVVVGSTDSNIYCFELKSGKLLWKYKCEKSVLSSPTIFKGNVYIGASDGIFRTLNLITGKLVWSFNQVSGFVETKPFVDKQQVVFGDWANTLYSLDTKTGKLQWSWKCKGSRMYSPAAVYPVKTKNKIFFVTPERKTYCVDARNGIELWSANGGRESIGISPDKSKIYVKTMSNTLIAFSTQSNNAKKIWEIISGLNYDIAPTPTPSIMVKGVGELVFVPTDKGNIFCFSGSDGTLLWKHKVSVALINSIVPLPGNKLLVSTMDGIVTLLSFSIK
ncbi:MAG: PQQ-binding-like beta-propeller repeat protein [Bacteroidales bacterium]|nr:PQQ-binding-like beta-propeller repeat protein [Bacteroidales bacterium]